MPTGPPTKCCGDSAGCPAFIGGIWLTDPRLSYWPTGTTQMLLLKRSAMYSWPS